MRRAKDISKLREADSAIKQHKSNSGVLRDLSLKHKVKMFWDLSEEAKTDQIFKLQIDDYVVYLDAEQILRYLRWV
jgi:hypothetical protein